MEKIYGENQGSIEGNRGAARCKNIHIIHKMEWNVVNGGESDVKQTIKLIDFFDTAKQNKKNACASSAHCIFLLAATTKKFKNKMIVVYCTSSSIVYSLSLSGFIISFR